MARKTVPQQAAAIEASTDNTPWCINPRAGVFNGYRDIGPLKRLGGLRVAEFVEFAEGQGAIGITPAQDDAVRMDVAHSCAGEVQGHIDFDQLSGQVGACRIADNKVADTLGAETDRIDFVACPDIPLCKRILHKMVGNIVALGPCEQQQQREQDANAAENAPLPLCAAIGSHIDIARRCFVGRILHATQMRERPSCCNAICMMRLASDAKIAEKNYITTG